jgi:hypothetical protein
MPSKGASLPVEFGLSDIAWLQEGYDTLVYELMQQKNQLQIVLIEGDYTEDNNYTERIMNR